MSRPVVNLTEPVYLGRKRTRAPKRGDAVLGSGRESLSDHDVQRYHRLALAVLADSIKVLKERPADGPVDKGCAAELRFWREPKRSAFWCEAAGFDWDVFRSWLTESGILPRTAA